MDFRNTFRLSGHVSHPKSVRCNFVWRGHTMHQRKAAVRISNITSLGVHNHHLKPNLLTHMEYDRLQLNHYQIQSKEYYEKVKMTRGDVNRGDKEQMRNWAYFYERDVSDCVDTELCSILGCCAS